MKLLAAALAVALAVPASAQLTSSVGPPVTPLGGQAVITMSNDSGVDYQVGQACPFSVRTTSGQLVYDVDCPTFVPVPLPAGSVANFWWELYDNTFTPVPAGDYVITVEMPDGSLPSHTITVGGTDAGVAFLGAPLLGTTRGLYLEAPSQSFVPYVLAASSATAPGIPTCGGVAPLFPDGVFLASLNPSSGIFVNFQGTLGFVGDSYDPAVSIPSLPSLSGASVSFSFLALDFSQPCPVTAIAAPTTITIL